MKRIKVIKTRKNKKTSGNYTKIRKEITKEFKKKLDSLNDITDQIKSRIPKEEKTEIEERRNAIQNFEEKSQ